MSAEELFFSWQICFALDAPIRTTMFLDEGDDFFIIFTVDSKPCFDTVGALLQGELRYVLILHFLS